MVRDDATPGWPQLRHRDVKILNIDQDGYADLVDNGGNVRERVRLALSREVGTWHPRGGYGCA